MNQSGILSLALVAILGGLPGTSAGSPVTNGDFESGNINGWFSWGMTNPNGTTAIASGAAGYSPLTGSNSALIVAMSIAPVPPYSCISDKWNINCPQPLAFAAQGAAIPTHTNYEPFSAHNHVQYAFYRGAYIAQDVIVNQNDRLTWSWATGGIDTSRDFARFYATDGVDEFVIDDYQNLRSFSFSSSGIWSIYFGLNQREDPHFYTTLTLDSIVITQVPEPSTLWLMAAAAVSWVARRRSMQRFA